MSYPDNDDLDRALQALDIFTVWQIAHRDGVVTVPAPQRDGVVKSPFREDGARGSFSVIHNGKGFRDHGGQGVHGSVWRFVELCWPNESKGQTATRCIEMSGIIRTPAPKKAAAEPGGAGMVVDESVLRAAKSIERRRRADEALDRVYQDLSKKLLPPVFKPGPVWPACVAARWEEGVEYLSADSKRMAEVAAARGWPVDWVADLAMSGLIGYPYERMATPGAKWAARQKAFLVQQPRMGLEGIELEPVGYHQHWFVPPRDGAPAQKGWHYMPSTPKKAPRSDYERDLLAYSKTMGSEPGAARALVQPLPFVIGDLRNPKLIVILEGQWDAITFYGACGWFHDTAVNPGVVVFGIRGAQGLDAFLGAWAVWLRRNRPRAWVIADNDAAGGTWRDQPPAEIGLPRPPGLGDRLIAAGCGGGERDEARAPVISWLKQGNGGKDFNDYFKAFGGKLGPEKMHAWMRKLGLDRELGRGV
jgi:hypothetical protein